MHLLSLNWHLPKKASKRCPPKCDEPEEAWLRYQRQPIAKALQKAALRHDSRGHPQNGPRKLPKIALPSVTDPQRRGCGTSPSVPQQSSQHVRQSIAKALPKAVLKHDSRGPPPLTHRWGGSCAHPFCPHSSVQPIVATISVTDQLCPHTLCPMKCCPQTPQKPSQSESD